MLTSRVARKAIDIPKGVDVKVNGNTVNVKGPKGSLQVKTHEKMDVVVKDSSISIVVNDKGYGRSGSGQKLINALPGTTRSLVNNAVLGVSQGFERKLNLVGVGYRALLKGKTLSLSLGFSHPVEYQIPEGIVIESPSATEIIIKGVDKKLVGSVAADLKQLRKAEPYKGKGVNDPLDPVVRKETKKK